MCERSEGAHLGSEHPPQLILEDRHFNLVVEELLARLEHQGVEVASIRGPLGKATEVRDYAPGSCDDRRVFCDLVRQVSVI